MLAVPHAGTNGAYEAEKKVLNAWVAPTLARLAEIKACEAEAVKDINRARDEVYHKECDKEREDLKYHKMRVARRWNVWLINMSMIVLFLLSVTFAVIGTPVLTAYFGVRGGLPCIGLGLSGAIAAMLVLFYVLDPWEERLVRESMENYTPVD